MFLIVRMAYEKKTERIGFRTINPFEGKDIEADLNTSVSNGIHLEKTSCNFSLVYKQGENKSRISFSNDAKMSRNGQPEINGSFIDIDTFHEGNTDDISAQIDSLHTLGKQVFFESLKDNFVNSMGPVYNV